MNLQSENADRLDFPQNQATEQNETIISAGGTKRNNKESEQRKMQLKRRFKKDSTIYGIPVKNTSKLDYAQ